LGELGVKKTPNILEKKRGGEKPDKLGWGKESKPTACCPKTHWGEEPGRSQVVKNTKPEQNQQKKKGAETRYKKVSKKNAPPNCFQN